MQPSPGDFGNFWRCLCWSQGVGESGGWEPEMLLNIPWASPCQQRITWPQMLIVLGPRTSKRCEMGNRALDRGQEDLFNITFVEFLNILD